MDAHKREMELLSNSIAAYAHIRDNPESFGLYFVLGVCFGLVLTLCLLVIRISCQPRTHTLPAKPRKSLKDSIKDEKCAREQPEEEDEESDNNDEAETINLTTDIPLGNHTPTNDGTLTINVFTSAEELERAQRLEERERIIREIWRNGQPDILEEEYFQLLNNSPSLRIILEMAARRGLEPAFMHVFLPSIILEYLTEVMLWRQGAGDSTLFPTDQDNKQWEIDAKLVLWKSMFFPSTFTVKIDFGLENAINAAQKTHRNIPVHFT